MLEGAHAAVANAAASAALATTAENDIRILYKCILNTMLRMFVFIPLLIVQSFMWYKLDDTKKYVGQFLDTQNLTNCFGRVVNYDAIQLKCWRENELITVGFSFFV